MTKMRASAADASQEPPASSWLLVLCMVGVDYFSTLAYLPAIAVRAGGALAPIAAVAVSLITLGVALPVYLYTVGRSPHGKGATGLLEHVLPGWRGKLLILIMLAFIATDYVVTQNLSIADAAEHVRGNPIFENLIEQSSRAIGDTRSWSDSSWWRPVAGFFDRQLVVTLALFMLSFAFWAYWKTASPRRFLQLAAVVVAAFLIVNGAVIAACLLYIRGEGSPLFDQWLSQIESFGIAWESASLTHPWRWIWPTVALVPHLALALSGFELSMATAPFVAGSPDDDPDRPRGRIRNTRKLLIAAAAVMSLLVPLAVLVVAILMPPQMFENGGSAVHRALSHLAHGGVLAQGIDGHRISPLFGPTFGLIYDVVTVTCLCLAGSCVLIALRDFVPEYLNRLGMELQWARHVGVKLWFFNVLVVVVSLLFQARIDALQWVYATSVLVLLAGASLAATLDVWRRVAGAWLRPLAMAPFATALLLFTALVGTTVSISRAGLEIAASFVVGLLGTSLASRWLRSLELRFEGFDFVDEASKERWERLRTLEFQVLTPHRPGLHSRLDKERAIRRTHRIPQDVPVVFLEAEVGDASEFYQRPLLRYGVENGQEVIWVTRCVSVAHVIAAVGLELSETGQPPEIHFGWPNESPFAATVAFLVFGQGNVPLLVRELIRREQPDVSRQPRVIVG